MQTNRIPDFNDKSLNGMHMWFAEMLARELLFHPDDDPADIIRISDGTPTFIAPEVEAARKVLGEMFDLHHDEVYEAAYESAMKAMAHLLNA